MMEPPPRPAWPSRDHSRWAGAAVGRGCLEVTELSEISDAVKVFWVVVIVVPHDALQRVRRQEAESGRGCREPALGEVASNLKEQVIPRELLV